MRKTIRTPAAPVKTSAKTYSELLSSRKTPTQFKGTGSAQQMQSVNRNQFSQPSLSMLNSMYPQFGNYQRYPTPMGVPVPSLSQMNFVNYGYFPGYSMPSYQPLGAGPPNSSSQALSVPPFARVGQSQSQFHSGMCVPPPSGPPPTPAQILFAQMSGNPLMQQQVGFNQSYMQNQSAPFQTFYSNSQQLQVPTTLYNHNQGFPNSQLPGSAWNSF